MFSRPPVTGQCRKHWFSGQNNRKSSGSTEPLHVILHQESQGCSEDCGNDDGGQGIAGKKGRDRLYNQADNKAYQADKRICTAVMATALCL